MLKDVCDLLGLSNSRMVADRLADDERTQSTVIDGMGRPQQTTIINESGLYSVILRSDKPDARSFRVVLDGLEEAIEDMEDTR